MSENTRALLRLVVALPVLLPLMLVNALSEGRLGRWAYNAADSIMRWIDPDL